MAGILKYFTGGTNSEEAGTRGSTSEPSGALIPTRKNIDPLEEKALIPTRTIRKRRLGLGDDVIGVLFQLESAPTEGHSGVLVSGNLPELGCWDPHGKKNDRALRLRGSARLQESWAMQSPVFLRMDAANEKGKEQREYRKQHSENKKEQSENGKEKVPAGQTQEMALVSGGVDGGVGTTVTMASPLGEGAPTFTIEYKFLMEASVVDIDGRYVPGDLHWEQIANRKIELPRKGGLLWIVSVPGWDVDEPAQLAHAPLKEFDLESYQGGYFYDPEAIEHVGTKDPPHILGAQIVQRSRERSGE